MSKKLFVSIPMADRDADDILDSMRDIANFVSSQFEEDFELIEQYRKEEPPSDVVNRRAWYLGKSIVDMADADLVAFDAGWRDAQGCIIEHMVCALYNIPYVDVTMNYDLDDTEVNDYTYDINEAGRLNEVLSEAYEQASGEAEDFEDALGFEHDDVNDLTEDDSEDEEVVNVNDIHSLAERRKKIADILKRSRARVKSNRNQVKHSNESYTDISDEFDDPDALEPGEYDADTYFSHSGIKGMKWGVRRYQNPDGSLTPLGREHYGYKGSEDTVFISGSSKTQFEDSGYYRKDLSEKIRKQIDDEISKHSHIIVGDAPGIDRQVQDYLKESNYDNVEIFGPGNKDVRYKADKRWKSTTVDNPDAEPNSKEWLASKDQVMSEIADRGIAVILDDGAKATRKNIDRLIANNKNVYIFELSKHGSSYDRHIH